MAKSSFLFIASVALLLVTNACDTDVDCSLNGICNEDNVCKCDKPWSGNTCDVMSFLPVDFPQGYGQQPAVVSWGGGVLYDQNAELYHLYVSAMTNDCPLQDWTTNSRIEHATSRNITGPYQFQDVAVDTWSHNSAPIQLSDGTYAIVHIGDGSGDADGGINCTSAIQDNGINDRIGGGSHVLDYSFLSEKYSLPPHNNRRKIGSRAGDGSTIHVSDNINGPWSPLKPNTLGNCNNPAPWVHPNGTIFIVCGDKFLKSESIQGPWLLVSEFSHSGGPYGVYEDPYLYTDKNGNFHCLYHVYDTSADQNQCVNSTVSAHIFSPDGFTWFTSPVQPYTTQIELTSGETITVSTRERPKLFFDSTGTPTHLLNGVCSQSQCPEINTPCVDCKYTYPDYTLIQPLDV